MIMTITIYTHTKKNTQTQYIYYIILCMDCNMINVIIVIVLLVEPVSIVITSMVCFVVLGTIRIPASVTLPNDIALSHIWP